MQILDATIRDGSYAIDFKFSCEDVVKISSKLEKLGIPYIEIGHGLGLNASSLANGVSLHTDLEYMQAAQKTLSSSKFGFFCSPGIARLEDLKILKENGGSFVRIGANADQPEKLKTYVEEARNLGLTPMVNLMKSYAVSPKQFAENALLAQNYGAEYVYVVDSAGCMLPENIREIYFATRELSDVKLGFHGHNNLGLAVSNTVLCAELGFDLVDCTLQGLGRSSGNAPLEQVVMILERMGYNLKIDIPRLLEYGYTLVHEVSDKELQNPIDLVCGYAGFHSGFIKDIYKCCHECKVDPMRLIIAYSQVDQKNMNLDMLKKVADQLPKDEDENPYNYKKFLSEIYNND